MIDTVHRVLTGQTVTRIELTIAGIVVVLWIAMDVHQYISWLFEKTCP